MFYLAWFAPVMRIVAVAGGNVVYENFGPCVGCTCDADRAGGLDVATETNHLKRAVAIYS
jgi:hypothetical protein